MVFGYPKMESSSEDFDLVLRQQAQLALGIVNKWMHARSPTPGDQAIVDGVINQWKRSQRQGSYSFGSRGSGVDYSTKTTEMINQLQIAVHDYKQAEPGLTARRRLKSYERQVDSWEKGRVLGLKEKQDMLANVEKMLGARDLPDGIYSRAESLKQRVETYRKPVLTGGIPKRLHPKHTPPSYDGQTGDLEQRTHNPNNTFTVPQDLDERLYKGKFMTITPTRFPDPHTSSIRFRTGEIITVHHNDNYRQGEPIEVIIENENRNNEGSWHARPAEPQYVEHDRGMRSRERQRPIGGGFGRY